MYSVYKFYVFVFDSFVCKILLLSSEPAPRCENHKLDFEINLSQRKCTHWPKIFIKTKLVRERYIASQRISHQEVF